MCGAVGRGARMQTYSTGVLVFCWNVEVAFTNVPSSPHTSSYMSGYVPGDCAAGLVQPKPRHARFESSEAVANPEPAVVRTAVERVELHGCCATQDVACSGAPQPTC